MQKILTFILFILLFACGPLSAQRWVSYTDQRDVYSMVLRSTIKYLPPNTSFLDAQTHWEKENTDKKKLIFQNPTLYFNIQSATAPLVDKKFFTRYKRLSDALGSNWIFCSYALTGKVDLTALTYSQMESLERIFSLRTSFKRLNWYKAELKGNEVFIIQADEQISIQIFPEIRELKIISNH